MKTLKSNFAPKNILVSLGSIGFAILFVWFAMQFPPIPHSAQADPTPTPTPTCTPFNSCVGYNATTPTPTITAAATCYPSPTCTGCNQSPTPGCAPDPWPALHGNEPPMTAISSPTPSDGTTLEWRIYPPHFVYDSNPTPTPPNHPTPTPGPVVLVVHGGNWNFGDPFQLDIERACVRLSQEGFWVFSPSYRLAPCQRITNQPGHVVWQSGRPPEQTDDVMAAIIAAKHSVHCNGKLGVLGSSVGGFLSTYAAVYPDSITEAGRPQWVPANDRPTCVVTFSSPFDLADQLPSDTDEQFGWPKYLRKLQNYIGNCNIETVSGAVGAREASPVYQINRATLTDFRPMFMVQAETDDTNPHRQIDDIVNALQNADVDPCEYTVSYVPASDGGGHALVLWSQHDPNYPDCPSHTIGDSVIAFFHEHLE
jgi:acetyl esterase/lipase